MGLCLGTYVLAYAGLLDGRGAATHWEFEQEFVQRFPRVRLDTNALYVDVDGLFTSAGTAAPASPRRATVAAPSRRMIDAPTRAFHWLFALCFLGAYLSADGERWRLLHVVLGYSLAGLLAFRVAYGLVGPFAARLQAIVDEEGAFYKIIQSVLVAHLHGNAAQISVEIGRGDIPSSAQPSVLEMEEHLSATPVEA